jgi:single-strand DNA-binding protein
MVNQQPKRDNNARSGGGGSSLNKALIIGNLGGDPEMRFTSAGNPVTTFNVATNRVYNSPDGERKEETEWFTVVTWTRLAETCNQFLTKGQKVYVEGRLHNRTWEGQDGVKRSRVEITAERVIFLDRKAAAPLMDDKSSDGETGDIEPQDIPF